MKKLLALLLSVIMAVSLAAPAFAAEPGEAPVDGDGYFVDGEPAPIYAPGDAIPISAILDESESLGIIGGQDGPTAIITSTPVLGDVSKEALGGVPGQVGVMVNGEYVKFPDAAPEIANGRTMVPVRALVETLGGEVSYEDGAVTFTIDESAYEFVIGSATVTVRAYDTGIDTPLDTIEMDCAPYIKGGRTYVPIRFIAEALGYEVGWDNEYETAILLDREALAADINKDFTIMNRVQANRGVTIGAGKSSLTDAKCTLTATLFDTLNGSKTYKADLTGKTLMNAEAINGTYSFTLSDNAVDALVELVNSATIEYDMDYGTLARTVITGLKDMEVIMTADGKVWAHAPILDEMSGEKNVWASMDMGAELGQLLALQMDAANQTIGSVLTALISTDSVAAMAGFNEMVKFMDQLYSDDNFTTTGGTSTLTIGVDDLMALYGDMGLDLDEVKSVWKEYNITLKVDSKGGATVTEVMEINARQGVPAVKVTVNATQSAGKANMTMTVHVANMGEIKLTASSTEKASSDAPKTEPPEDATIIEADAPATLPLAG